MSNETKDKSNKTKIFENIKKILNATDTSSDEENPIVAGRVSDISSSQTSVSISTTFISDILTKLNSTTDKYDAMDLLVDETPFGRMALNIYTSLSNPDGEFIFYDPETGERTKEPDIEFEKFRKQRFMNNDGGLDAVFSLLVRSLYTRGDMAAEIVVAQDLSYIQDVAVIDPSTFSKMEWLDAEQRYAIYQTRSDNQTVDLYSGNFLRIPYQPMIGDPYGTLPFLPAIQATINYYQHILDATTILNRIGYPRYKTTIDENAVLESARPNEKDTFEKRSELMEQVFDQAATQLRAIGRDSDIITFSSTQVETIGGTANGSGIDLRAWFEIDAVDLCNAYGLNKIYLNSESSGSYALGTAQQEAFIERIDHDRDNVVRFKNAIGDMFCRVKGFSAVCEFKAEPIDWEKKDDKWNAKLKEFEYYRRQVEAELITNDTMANILNGDDSAVGDGLSKLMYIEEIVETETTETEE